MKDRTQKEIADRKLEEALYESVARELSEGVRKEGLWLKAIASSGGDKERAGAVYIELRAQSMLDDAALAEARAQKRVVPAQYLGVDGRQEPASKQDGRLTCKRCGGVNRIDRFRAGPTCGHCNASFS